MSLGESGAHAVAGPAAVAFQAELALEGVEHRLDPLPDPAEVAVAGAFVASVRAQQGDPEGGDLVLETASCRPTSSCRGARRPVSTAMVSRVQADLAFAGHRAARDRVGPCGCRCSDPVSYTGVLPIRACTQTFRTGLLAAERARRRTRAGHRRPGSRRTGGPGAALVLRGHPSHATGPRPRHRAGHGPTRYLYEAVDVLAAATPGLHQVLQAARAAGHLSGDGTVVRIDQVRRPGPNPGVDLWWSGKHHHHGGDNHVLSAPDGWPIWATRASSRGAA
jgi:hypothetical protein